MSEVRGAVERIDVPAIVAALIVQSLLFPQHVVRGKLLTDALADQRFGSAVGRGHQVRIALVFDLQFLVEVLDKQRARFARNGRHGWKEAPWIDGLTISALRMNGTGHRASDLGPQPVKYQLEEWI